MEGEIARCGISLESQLDSQHIGICARRAIDFKLLSAELGINEAEEMSINVDNDNHESKKVSLLRFWIQKYGTEATYGRLFSAFDALNWRHVKQKCIAG